ncbi:MAG: hypothetical protein OEZ36_01250 [Spirochaetota bacterium]|nr:hypothetical protein [Spirochaetota bacterium]
MKSLLIYSITAGLFITGHFYNPAVYPKGSSHQIVKSFLTGKWLLLNDGCKELRGLKKNRVIIFKANGLYRLMSGTDKARALLLESSWQVVEHKGKNSLILYYIHKQFPSPAIQPMNQVFTLTLTKDPPGFTLKYYCMNPRDFSAVSKPSGPHYLRARKID